MKKMERCVFATLDFRRCLRHQGHEGEHDFPLEQKPTGHAGPIALENAISGLVESGKRIQALRDANESVEMRRRKKSTKK